MKTIFTCIIFLNCFNLFSQCDEPLSFEYEIYCILNPEPINVVVFAISGGSGFYNLISGDFVGNGLVHGLVYEVLIPINDTLNLNIYDADEENTNCQPLIVNEFLSEVSCPDPECADFFIGLSVICPDVPDGTFSVFLNMFNGTPPYFYNDIIIDDNYIFGPFQSYQNEILEITDANSCVYTINVYGIYCAYNVALDLIKFSAELINDKYGLIEWETASEMNIDYFLLEQSIDGINFSKIAHIEASNKNDIINRYNFLDKQHISKHKYYRLSEVQEDGHSKIISNVISLEFPETFNDIEISTIVEELKIQYIVKETNLTSDLRIYDINGRLISESIFEVNAGSTNKYISLNRYEQGIYILKIKLGMENYTFKFYKN